MDFRSLFPKKPIMGMIHMPPLPGAPGNSLSMKELTEFALSEAGKLEGAGLDACIVENVGETRARMLERMAETNELCGDGCGMRTAEAHDTDAAAAGRRGDGGDGVVDGGWLAHALKTV